ncbi:MAG: flavodoxin domain-containing protein [Anaerolineaceae bacterium]|nr:flavodoxin domain-containing protein [Anaerolineaceae bacterium]
MTKILVAYGTAAGSTKEVAETIGEVLRNTGLDVDVCAVESIKSLAGYDSLVLGTGVRAFRLLDGTMKFLRKFKKQIREIPFTAFLVCLTMCEDTPEHRDSAMKFAKPLFKVKEPLSLGLFGGVMNPDKLTGVAKMMFQNAKFEDGRNWDAIKAWANEVSALLNLN